MSRTKKNNEHHNLYVNMLLEFQKNGASDKEVFVLLLSSCVTKTVPIF